MLLWHDVALQVVCVHLVDGVVVVSGRFVPVGVQVKLQAFEIIVDLRVRIVVVEVVVIVTVIGEVDGQLLRKKTKMITADEVKY